MGSIANNTRQRLESEHPTVGLKEPMTDVSVSWYGVQVVRPTKELE